MGNFPLGSNPLVLFILDEWKLLLALTVVFVLYFHYTKTFTYFADKGIKFMKPTIFIGNLGPRLTLKKSIHQFDLDIYNYFKGQPFGGIFQGRRPVLVIFDAELIKAVTVRDFDHFVDRNSLNSREVRYLSRSLLNLKGHEWKGVRSVVTPAFSSARLRNMLPILELCSNQMVEFLRKFDKQDVEMKDTMGHFTLEVIGACAFGVDCDALHENAHFVKVAEKFNYMSAPKRILVFFILMFAPQLFRFLNISFMNPETTGELIRMLKAAKAERRASGKKGNDFLQLLIDAADKERLDAQESGKEYLDDDTIDAQCLLFLIAGYETSSTLLSFALHVLARHPELQETVRRHVQDVTEGREITYELLSELTYLEAFLLETLRMYPPLSRVDRVVTKPYTLPGTRVQLAAGAVVAVPVYGVHMDPAVYPEPHEFRPERFLGEEKQSRPSHLFLAFGVGPRNCIGLRFAMISAKLAMVCLLKNFKFSRCSRTEDDIAFERKGILLKAEKGLWVNIENIDEN